MRYFTCLSNKHQDKLTELLKEIDKFVYDSESNEKKEFFIESFELRKAIYKRINEMYNNTGVFFEMTKNSSSTIVKKTKK